MVSPNLNYKVVFNSENNFQEYSSTVILQLEKVVQTFAFEIEALAKQTIPVDQGAAKASIYVATSQNSGKDEAYAKAKTAALTEESIWHHKGRNLEFADDDEREMNVPELNALICVGVIYGYWLELGDYEMHAQNPGARHPYLSPAVEYYRQQFFDACGKVLAQVK